MELLVLVFAVCAVGRGTIQTSQLLNFGPYWRDWNVNSPMAEDAVAGGVDKDGYPTYVARSFFNKSGQTVPGHASPEAKKMWFHHDNLEHTTTNDVDILCVLNQNRLKWVVAKKGQTIAEIVGDNVIIFGGRRNSDYTTIGRRINGNEILVGRFYIYKGRFWGLGVCRNGKCWMADKCEVLVYVKDGSADTIFNL